MDNSLQLADSYVRYSTTSFAGAELMDGNYYGWDAGTPSSSEMDEMVAAINEDNCFWCKNVATTNSDIQSQFAGSSAVQANKWVWMAGALEQLGSSLATRTGTSVVKSATVDPKRPIRR